MSEQLSMRVNLSGVVLENPLVVASGIVPPVPSLVRKVCLNYRPGAITSKSLTSEPLPPHRSPTVLPLRGVWINAVGLGNPGSPIAKDLRTECVTITSLAGQRSEDFLRAVEDVQKYSDIIELNLSSPNRLGFGASLKNRVREIVKDVRGATAIPLFVKLGPWDDVVSIAGSALEGGSNGLTLVNTIKGMAIDIRARRPALSYGTGGISGKGIHPVAVRVVYEVYREYGAEIIGMGGVYDWVDALELVMAGAKAVGVGTSLIEKGFGVIREIIEGLQQFTEEEGVNIQKLVGIANRR